MTTPLEALLAEIRKTASADKMVYMSPRMATALVEIIEELHAMAKDSIGPTDSFFRHLDEIAKKVMGDTP